MGFRVQGLGFWGSGFRESRLQVVRIAVLDGWVPCELPALRLPSSSEASKNLKGFRAKGLGFRA